MAALGDIQKLVKICPEHKLNFLKRVFEEYATLLTEIDINNSMNDMVYNMKRLQSEESWTNHTLFGTNHDIKI